MFEIKVRMMNEEMALRLMAPLALGAPDRIEKGSHTYLTDDHATRKIKEAEGVRTYFVITRHQAGFSFTVEPLDAARAEELLRTYPPKMTLMMTRSVWQRDGVMIALNIVENLGVFLEFQGDDYEALKAWPKKIGFVETHYLTRAYDELS
ncbi:hypothetical protein A3J43_02890 [Candidatus Uhrbacteria bacterium RIFCSPHIGHO2_12_FULL_54_23]|uniref:CYTH domain-containing protein n=3 Tax=Candidatus Uhriibacteriota TaxID=1752732 RepID=A0A1F7UJH4_9BACT|nr:MAG: hypothetical protein A3J43_02890 [Candidatus Uhrbacteria bacterium RIFCSPHIGHO2_12_FULL_54_23]OGL85534.1 MAG: hypothetical protein A3B36_00540 [Candidatus Uhrbacteria bacterium RIFCSPLOWO2_01_FULL_55_36]OGL89620.1 MAG: hypothetical protein A3J36_01120 [Candidatus Uhrbacteria bacterium RIFCSPLOWO2_02_FULL_54_37]